MAASVTEMSSSSNKQYAVMIIHDNIFVISISCEDSQINNTI